MLNADLLHLQIKTFTALQDLSEQHSSHHLQNNSYCYLIFHSLPFSSAETIPCKLGSSPNQNTHNSFAMLIQFVSRFDWQVVNGLLRHAHSMSWVRANEKDFNTGSSLGMLPDDWLNTYFLHFKPHKSVCWKVNNQ